MLNVIASPFYWNANPEIFMFTENFGLRWYSLLYGSAFLIGYAILAWEMKKNNKPIDYAEELLMYMFIAVIIGARLGHVFFYDWDYYSQHLSEIPMIWKGGLASHGAAITIPIALWLFKRKHSDVSYLWILDRVAIPLSLGSAFVRIGNFFNHEIVGKPTGGDFGVVFMRNFEESVHVPRYPSQLFEAILYITIFIVVLTMYKRSKYQPREGSIISTMVIMMFVGRFFLEFFKSGSTLFTIGNLEIIRGHVLSIPFIIIGIAIWYISKKKATNTINN
ncbi:MAG: prolipoprotein diacylglyceryl transferase [Chitinophagales bacterium]|nr:prolipoprotein diacylglyceryl transferase [Chitinophagales bacterium]